MVRFKYNRGELLWRRGTKHVHQIKDKKKDLLNRKVYKLALLNARSSFEGIEDWISEKYVETNFTRVKSKELIKILYES